MFIVLHWSFVPESLFFTSELVDRLSVSVSALKLSAAPSVLPTVNSLCPSDSEGFVSSCGVCWLSVFSMHVKFGTTVLWLYALSLMLLADLDVTCFSLPLPQKDRYWVKWPMGKMFWFVLWFRRQAILAMIMIIMMVKSPKAVPKIMAIPTFDSENRIYDLKWYASVRSIFGPL